MRYAAGEIDHDQLIQTLVAWPWTVTTVLDRDNPLPEALERGSWEDLSRALRAGYLTEDDYKVLFERIA